MLTIWIEPRAQASGANLAERQPYITSREVDRRGDRHADHGLRSRLKEYRDSLSSRKDRGNDNEPPYAAHVYCCGHRARTPATAGVCRRTRGCVCPPAGELYAAGRPSLDGRRPRHYNHDEPQAWAEEFAQYPLYWLGPRFASYNLQYIDHRPPPAFREYVEFTYGRPYYRRPAHDLFCAVPLSIVVRPGCLPAQRPPDRELSHVRGEAVAQIWERSSRRASQEVCAS